MATYIALLRAINVGGHRKIRMADLRQMFNSIGFENVKTYIQNGNVIFSAPEFDPVKLAKTIESNIKNTFGHNVDVIIRTPEHLNILVTKNPFRGKNQPPFKLYITFFKNSLTREKQNDLISFNSDIEQYAFANSELFSLVNKGTDQKEIFSNNFVEKITGTAATTRNWRSVNKILNLAMDF